MGHPLPQVLQRRSEEAGGLVLQSSVVGLQQNLFGGSRLYLKQKSPARAGLLGNFSKRCYAATSLALMCSTRWRCCSARAMISLCGRLVNQWWRRAALSPAAHVTPAAQVGRPFFGRDLMPSTASGHIEGADVSDGH